jgi:N6-adenosine-specific RNA methylase IME4
VKGQACSWQDMRKIRHILANMERLRGQYDALTRCVNKSSVSNWRRAIEVMEAVQLIELRRFQPTHAMEVARRSPREDWPTWVERCEREGWTVVELRQELMRHRKDKPRGAGTTVGDLNDLIDRGDTFGTIYADPPWAYDNQATRAATGNHYSTMSVDALCALPIGKLAGEAAHLHMWTTNGFLFEAPRIFSAWGFEFRSTFVWVKTQLGIGNYWRNSHEILLTAIRGDAKRFADKNLRSWLECGRGRHSSKPDQVRELLERASPGPRLELFGRRKVDGWTVWGDEVDLI